MDTAFSPEDLAFRAEVREFYQTHFTDELAQALANNDTSKAATIKWQKILADKGWVAPSWPEEFGGTNWSVTQDYLYDRERAAAGAPEVIPFGVTMVASVIIAFGNDAQKQHFLPRIYNSDDWWCQGYSEPGAGSDLAAMKTRAERDGDDYIVNGAKIWTTYAHYADWIFCLVRTSSEGAKQSGISFLLIDMKTPGITINKIESIDNKHSLNEVVFDHVRVPAANRIGEENKGWTYAKVLLAHERTSIAGVANSVMRLAQLKDLAKTEMRGGQALIEDTMIQQRFADIEIELMALEYTELRVLSGFAEGKGLGAESSLLKVKGSEIQQSIQQLRLDLAGYYGGVLNGELTNEQVGHAFGDSARGEYMYGRAATIYGGSTEVQKNITAKAVLGL